VFGERCLRFPSSLLHEEVSRLLTPEEAAIEMLRKIRDTPDMDEAKRRSLFLGYLGNLFPNYSWQISEYATGAEHAVKTVSRDGKKLTVGRIDTRKGALLIEYKSNLSNLNQITEGESELSRYVAGLINKEGLHAVSRCIITDILRWRDYSVICAVGESKETVKPEDVNMKLLGDFKFSESKAQQFLEVVERLVFGDVPLVATGQLLVDLFGLGSVRYSRFSAALKTVWMQCRLSSETDLGLKLWSDFIENCFDKSATPDESTYLDHAYLVILARAIAASALASPTELSSPDFMKMAMTGEFFASGVHRIDDFVEDDFFRWVKSGESLKRLDAALHELHNDLLKLDFVSARKLNLLADIYQQIMPPEHKTEYGEVFTPTWLAERIVSEIPQCWRLGVRVLDPACGTGGFLRAVIERKLKSTVSNLPSQKILDSVLGDICGLDINPISVTIAKTNIALSLAQWLRNSDKPTEIPIYLCDSLFIPSGLVSKESHGSVSLNFIDDNTRIEFPREIFEGSLSEFDLIVRTANQVGILLAKGELVESRIDESMESAVAGVINRIDADPTVASALKNGTKTLVLELSRRIRARRNNVWAFVLKNTYRPSLLRGRFDVVMGNPPWLAMSAFPDARYKQQLKELGERYDLIPSAQSRHHLEISTIFAVHSVSQYLVESGRFGFVLPRVILIGDHHHAFRMSKFKKRSPMKVERAWDLEKVNPLFGRPACVLFGTRDTSSAGVPHDLECVELSGNPFGSLSEQRQDLKLSFLGDKSSFMPKGGSVGTSSYYSSLFRQGADLMPRRAVMMDIVGNPRASVLSIQTSAAEKVNKNNKPPYDGIDLKGTIESNLIFSTLKSDAVLPFVVGEFSCAALPVEIVNGGFKLLDLPGIAAKGWHRGKKWFEDVDRELIKLSKSRLIEWIQEKNKLIDQPATASQNMVVYGAGGTNICAAVADGTAAAYPFINDQTLYVWRAPNKEEAEFVCGMLNSAVVNDAIKGHQPKGDFGEQHVHKLPLQLIPRYDPLNSLHRDFVAEVERIIQVSRGLSANDPRYLDTRKSLASRRKMFFSALVPFMKELNRLANEIVDKGH